MNNQDCKETDLNALRDRAFNNAKEKGFYDGELSDKHCFMMVITELAEAVQADRKDRHARVEEFREQTERGSPFQEAFGHYMEGSVECELADAFIYLLSFALMCGKIPLKVMKISHLTYFILLNFIN